MIFPLVGRLCELLSRFAATAGRMFPEVDRLQASAV
jgi:hypothetical protein